MLDASGRAAYLQAAGGGSSTLPGPAMPLDAVAALTGLPRRALRDLAAAGALHLVEAADGPSFRGAPCATAAAHELLLLLGVPGAVAVGLVQPSSLDGDDARRAAAVQRLLAGTVVGGTLDADVQVLPAAHLVTMRVRVGPGQRWAASAQAHAELATFVRMHEMTPAGPVSVAVTDVAEEELGLEVSVPVEELVGSRGAVHPGHRAATQVAVARHIGDPLASASTGEALWRWLHEQGLTPCGLPVAVHAASDRIDICWPVA